MQKVNEQLREQVAAWDKAYRALEMRLTITQDELDQAQKLIAAIQAEAAQRDKVPF